MSDDEPPQETWEPRPVPEVTPETDSFWTAASRGELHVGHCPECDLHFYYPRAYCPDCLAEADTVPTSGNGTVYSYSVPSKVSGWPEEALPLVVAYVELDEGPRLISNLVECDPADVNIGDDVEVCFLPTEDEDIAIPLFRLSK